MIQVTTRLSYVTVGEQVFSFVVKFHCIIPLQHPWALMVPYRFYFRNIRQAIAALQSSLMSSFGSYGSRASIVTRWRTYFSIALTPL